MKINKEWIVLQLKALPYIGLALLFAGAIWFIASGTIIIFGR